MRTNEDFVEDKMKKTVLIMLMVLALAGSALADQAVKELQQEKPSRN